MDIPAMDERCQFREIWPGLLFLATGCLVIVCCWLGVRNRPGFLAAPAFFAGPILVLVGTNACARSMIVMYRNS